MGVLVVGGVVTVAAELVANTRVDRFLAKFEYALVTVDLSNPVLVAQCPSRRMRCHRLRLGPGCGAEYERPW